MQKGVPNLNFPVPFVTIITAHNFIMSAPQKYAIIDVETTGGSPKFERVTEIGVVISDGNNILDTFESLVNPGITIPEFITNLTGISNDMVREAPHFYEIAKEIVELTENTIFVAHNARFDYGFIRSEFQRLGYTYSRRQLCTVKLARKVFPGLPSYSLGKLIRHFGIEVSRRHRALDDAMATTTLLHMALHQHSGQSGIKNLVDRGIQETRLPAGISMEMLHQLPESPGVYYFHNADNQIVYVGKSINIQKRVMDHFRDHTVKAGRMHQHVRDISFEETGSELAALLLESYEIKRLTPILNRAQRAESFPYVVGMLYNQQGYLNFQIDKLHADAELPADVEQIGEYPKLSNAKGHLGRLVQELQLCRRLSGLEKNIGSCLYPQIGLCHGACMGHEPPETYNQRALQLVEKLSVRVPGTFAILDEGRSQDEQTVVIIENGRYLGFGYIDSDSFASHDDLRNSITPYPHNPEVMRIISLFLRKNPRVRRVPLDAPNERNSIS